MLTIDQDASGLRIYYRSYRLALVLLVLPPLMLFEHLTALLDGSIDSSELAALVIGVLLPLIGAHLLIEFGSFSFSQRDNRFRWHWRNLFRQRSLELPLERVVRVRREAVETGDSSGAGFNYRLVVELDDGEVIGLTRSYSSMHAVRLKQIVDQTREYLGHIVPMR